MHAWRREVEALDVLGKHEQLWLNFNTRANVPLPKNHCCNCRGACGDITQRSKDAP
jgi:hypothetical protein